MIDNGDGEFIITYTEDDIRNAIGEDATDEDVERVAFALANLFEDNMVKNARSMAKHEENVYSVDEESIENCDHDFHEWLESQGEKSMDWAVTLFAEELAEYLDATSDWVYDCLSAVKQKMGYEEE